MQLTTTPAPAYRNYWARKQLLEDRPPCFPVLRYWRSSGLSQVEQVYYNAVHQAGRLLDYGAGDLTVMRKLRQAGYAGEYHTLDIGDEYAYTYSDLSQVTETYDAILCLDVIEHLSLQDGLTLLSRLAGLLSPGGRLVLQTPNARCVRQPLAWDMTHLHCYNLGDLWAYLECLELDCCGYRVIFRESRTSWWEKLRFVLCAFVVTRICGSDYADNIALIGERRVGLS